jgi:hypothetical protein
MIRRLFVLVLFSTIVIGGSASFRPTRSANPEPCAQSHEAWLKQVSEKMETIKPGMTRWDLLRVLRTEGTPRRRFTVGGGPQPQGVLRESFVSQDCPYLRIDVELSGRDDPIQDVIVKVSKPYLQFATTN